jgi:hydrogenase nickel incorporation protein HypA/HybF
MHEMSLAEGILQVVEDAARTQGFSKVHALWLEIGELSVVEPEALRFCFDAVTRGSQAEGARLEIIRVPGTAWCMICSCQVAVSAYYEPCPQCGGYQIQITGGTEMRVKELSVE